MRAVLTYEAEGLKAYESRQNELRVRAEREAQEQAQKEREEAAQKAIDDRIAALTDQERLSLEVQAKESIKAKYPFFSDGNWEGAAAFATMMRSEMVRLMDTAQQGSEPSHEPTPATPEILNESPAPEASTEPPAATDPENNLV